MLDLISCGNRTIVDMDPLIPTITSTVVTIIMIGIPVLLVFFGMLDLGKAVMAQKEDEIKKGQQMFLRRLLSAAIVFFVVFIVQMVLGLVAPRTEVDENANVWNCFQCFVRGPENDRCR